MFKSYFMSVTENEILANIIDTREIIRTEKLQGLLSRVDIVLMMYLCGVMSICSCRKDNFRHRRRLNPIRGD